MDYNEQTSMSDVLAGMAAVDPMACYEFARRQFQADRGHELHSAAGLLHGVAFAQQLERPDDLMAWKYPDQYEGVDTQWLKDALQAASNGDRSAASALLVDQSFADITALSSVTTHLQQSCEQLQRFGVRSLDRQQSLSLE